MLQNGLRRADMHANACGAFLARNQRSVVANQPVSKLHRADTDALQPKTTHKCALCFCYTICCLNGHRLLPRRIDQTDGAKL